MPVIAGGDAFAAAQNALASTAPATSVAAIVPADTDLTFMPRALYIGGAGNIAVMGRDDTASTVIAVAAGAILPVIVKRVLATGTTASGIIGLY